MKFEKAIGVDEAGRGPLAGPVFAAAVFFLEEPEFANEIKDSKALSEKKREAIFEKIITSKVLFSVASADHKTIDKINILQATKKAMEQAISNIPDFEQKKIIIDGNFTLDLKVPHFAILKADQNILECAAASILAKVSRDKVMRQFAKIYPCYGFQFHKGYPTKKHREAIAKYGPCLIHRKTFKL